MGIRFQCHECNHGLNVKDFLAGKRGTCPKCGCKFRIPDADQEFSSPAEPQKKRSKTAEAEEAATVATLERPATETAPQPDPQDALSPLADPNAIWYVRPPSGGQFGPAESPLMQQWISESRVVPGSLVWREGWPQWRNAEEVFPEQFDVSPAATGVDIESELPSTTTATTPATPAASVETKPADAPNNGAVKRGKKQSQARLIAILIAVCLVLIATLIVVVNLTGGES